MRERWERTRVREEGATEATMLVMQTEEGRGGRMMERMNRKITTHPILTGNR
jgi:hypothetical protein